MRRQAERSKQLLPQQYRPPAKAKLRPRPRIQPR